MRCRYLHSIILLITTANSKFLIEWKFWLNESFHLWHLSWYSNICLLTWITSLFIEYWTKLSSIFWKLMSRRDINWILHLQLLTNHFNYPKYCMFTILKSVWKWNYIQCIFMKHKVYSIYLQYFCFII